MNPFSLEGKHILIVGASSGIGAATAVECSKMGATVSITGRNEDNLRDTHKFLYGANNQYYVNDITNTENIAILVEQVVNKNGPLHGFVYCAGIAPSSPLKLIRNQLLQSIYNVNVFAAIELAKQVSLKKNIAIQGSSFVFISSISAMVSQPGYTAYSSSKAALIAASRTLAIELAPKAIRVNSISPSMVQTELLNKMFSELTDEQIAKNKESHPLGLGTANDVAYASIYLLSEASRWVTGSNLIVDGGFSAK